MSVTTQPQNLHWKKDKDWSSPLRSCPCPQGLYACFCCPIYACTILKRAEEHPLSYCLAPMALGQLRTKIRTTYNIKGSLLEDCCVTTCCLCSCSMIQIDRELDHQGFTPKSKVALN